MCQPSVACLHSGLMSWCIQKLAWHDAAGAQAAGIPFIWVPEVIGAVLASTALALRMFVPQYVPYSSSLADQKTYSVSVAVP